MKRKSERHSHAAKEFKAVEMQAVIIRADGTREDLGTVAYWHRNPLLRWAWQLKRAGTQLFKRIKKGKV